MRHPPLPDPPRNCFLKNRHVGGAADEEFTECTEDIKEVSSFGTVTSFVAPRPSIYKLPSDVGSCVRTSCSRRPSRRSSTSTAASLMASA